MTLREVERGTGGGKMFSKDKNMHTLFPELNFLILIDNPFHELGIDFVSYGEWFLLCI